MTGKLRVFGIATHLSGLPREVGQVHAIVAATSWAKAAEAMGYGVASFRNHAAESGSEVDLHVVSLGEPGDVFWTVMGGVAGTDEYRGKWYRQGSSVPVYEVPKSTPTSRGLTPDEKEALREIKANLDASSKRMKKIDGYVWCDYHGEVHEDSTNPYGEDSPDSHGPGWVSLNCSNPYNNPGVNEHRSVYGRFTPDEMD